MAVIERGAEFATTNNGVSRAEGLLDEVIVAPGKLEETITPLQNEIVRPSRTIKRLGRRRTLEEIKAKIKEERDNHQNLIKGHTTEALKELWNPHSDIHPVIRTARLTPYVEGGKTTYDPNTLTAARDLGGQLLDLHEHLEAMEEEQPFVIVTYKPQLGFEWVDSLQLAYGILAPGIGLNPAKGEIVEEECECCEGYHQRVAPQLKLPIIKSNAVKPSVNKHEYLTDYQTAFNVNGKREERVAPSAGIFFRNPKDSIVLPTGKVFTEGATPIVMYDTDEGVIEIKAGSHSQDKFDEKSFCAIGARSVEQTIDVILDRSKGVYVDPDEPAEQPWRQMDIYELHNNGAKPKDPKKDMPAEYMRDMYSDVARLVIDGLHISAKNK